MQHSAPCLTSSYRRATSGTVADLLVDTDVCIDHLEGTARLPGRRTRLAYSVVTRAELLAGPPAQHEAVRRLLA